MQRQLYIDGTWTPAASGESFAVDNPATEAVIAQIARGGAVDVAHAVDAAKQAFAYWRWLSANTRAEMLHEVAQQTYPTSTNWCGRSPRRRASPSPRTKKNWSGRQPRSTTTPSWGGICAGG